MMKANRTLAFARHYGEMVIVMFLGMAVFGGLALLAGAAFGVSRSEMEADAPAAVLLGMGLSMTIPMVWWMSFRGHSRPANVAMAAAMFLPAVAMVGLLASGANTDLDSLLMIEHVVMFPAMFAAMLPFTAEFTHAHPFRAILSGARG